MNPALVIQLVQLLIGGALDVKQLFANNSTYGPQFQAALDANQPLSQALMDQLLAGDVAADANVQNA